MLGQFAGDLALYAANSHGEIVLCPPFHLLTDPALANMTLGGQDCHAEPKGAYTGSISAPMLRDCRCAYVILGHSERRRNNYEGNDLIAHKLKAALDAGLVPILCVGEQQGETPELVLDQQLSILKGLNAERLVIAYEPVWAIGSGKIPGYDEIGFRHSYIRFRAAELQAAQNLQIIYGGSVTAQNAQMILLSKEVDGVLVGGASLEAIPFAAIANAAH